MQEDIEKIDIGTGEKIFGWQTAYNYQTQIWFWRFRLHRFHREDPGEAYHDHPWWFVTFPLTSYIEDVLDPGTGNVERTLVRRFLFHFRPASHAHRVIGPWAGTQDACVPQVVPGVVTTLVLRGPVNSPWHYFRIGRGKVHRFPWRSYLETIEKKPARSE